MTEAVPLIGGIIARKVQIGGQDLFSSQADRVAA